MSGAREPIAVVRAIRPDDRAPWEDLFRAYFGFYGVVDPDPEAIETTWRRLLDPAVSPHGLVAVDGGGGLVGLVHHVFHASTWTVGPYCYLQDLFVAPSARRGGIGRALIEAVYEAADRAGASQVYWLTQDFNVTARRLYDEVAQKTDFIKYRR